MRLRICALLAFSVLSLVAVPVTAADSMPAKTVEPLSRELVTPESVLQLLVGLGVVVAAIFLVAWLLRRVGAVPMNNDQLKIVAGLALGQRERVLLVQVGDAHQVLLGVTQGKISKLCEFDAPVVEAEVASNEFAQRLRGALKVQGNKA